LTIGLVNQRALSGDAVAVIIALKGFVTGPAPDLGFSLPERRSSRIEKAGRRRPTIVVEWRLLKASLA